MEEFSLSATGRNVKVLRYLGFADCEKNRSCFFFSLSFLLSLFKMAPAGQSSLVCSDISDSESVFKVLGVPTHSKNDSSGFECDMILKYFLIKYMYAVPSVCLFFISCIVTSPRSSNVTSEV